MPTDNPKISAYVPQAVYNRFNQFKEENNLSMSQAVIKILSEYFSIPLGSDISNEFTSSLPSRLESFDAQLSDLKRLYILLSEKVDSIQTTSKLLINVPVVSSSELLSEPQDSLLEDENITVSSELVSSIPSEIPLNTSVGGEPSSILLSEPHQLPLIESFQSPLIELLNKLKSIPLSTKLLASRIAMKDPTGLSHKKKELSPEKFSDWLQAKDPDQIKWLPIIDEKSKISKVKGYVPADDTPLEKLQRLQEWIKLNA